MFLNYDWEAFQEYRIETDNRKLYPNRELIEAIYTLRNGYDYYSQTITHLLLNNYISLIQNEHPESNASLKNLSSRELEIVKLWGESNTNKEIADKLFISIRTVESHKNHIMQKLSLKTAVDLVKFAIKNNIFKNTIAFNIFVCTIEYFNTNICYIEI